MGRLWEELIQLPWYCLPSVRSVSLLRGTPLGLVCLSVRPEVVESVPKCALIWLTHMWVSSWQVQPVVTCMSAAAHSDVSDLKNDHLSQLKQVYPS